MTRRALPFAFLLPFASLLFWVCLVAIPTTLAYVSLQRSAHGAPAVQLRYGPYTEVLRRERFLPWSIQRATYSDARTIEAINLPAQFVHAALAVLLHKPITSWAPFGIFPQCWRAAIFPLYCLPFWWFLGLGVDDLVRRRTLHWPARVAGMLLWALTALLCAGAASAMSTADRNALVYPLWGFVLWSVLLAVFPVGWSMLLRRLRASQPPLPKLQQ